jgi:phage terminase large subunit
VKINNKYYVFDNPSRYFIVTGGRGSGKSFSINTILCILSEQAGHVILFTRYTLRAASISIIPEFVEKIELLGMQSSFRVTKDEIIHLGSGSKIIFRGIKTSSGNQVASLKSLQGVTTWVLDEAEELVDEKIFDTIDLSVRQKGIQNRVIMIMNPTTKEHFIYQRFFQGKGVQEGSNILKGDTTYVHTTYKDNIENLSESFLSQIEEIRKRRPEKYKHQILGGWLDKAEGVVFTNWSIGEFKHVSKSVFGQDYGFSVDPTTLVETNVDTTNKRIYLKLHYYKPNLTTSQIVELNRRFAGDSLIVGDSAEPRLITEMQSHPNNLNIIPAVKGQGSVTHGITLMQDYNLVVDPDSLELIKELNNYCWMEKKSSTPIDDYNHAIDAIRYAVTYQLENPNRGKYFVY